jgi:hypothetical protein
MDMTDLVQRFAGASRHLNVDGPPRYDCGRVILAGDPAGFRFLADFLEQMADAVASTTHPASKYGWHLAINPRDVQQLKLDNSIPVLSCDPAASLPS